GKRAGGGAIPSRTPARRGRALPGARGGSRARRGGAADARLRRAALLRGARRRGGGDGGRGAGAALHARHQLWRGREPDRAPRVHRRSGHEDAAVAVARLDRAREPGGPGRRSRAGARRMSIGSAAAPRLLIVAAAVLFSTGGVAIKAASLSGWQVA